MLSEGDIFLTAGEHAKLKTAMDECLRCYSALARLSMEQDERRWSIVSKHHFMWHLTWQGQYLNPRLWWRYGFEDFMGICRSLAESCTSGTASLKVAHRICDTYLLAQQWEAKRL